VLYICASVLASRRHGYLIEYVFQASGAIDIADGIREEEWDGWAWLCDLQRYFDHEFPTVG
jgi:hypothetical protein